MKAILASVLLVGLAAIKSTSAFSATSSWYWPETGNQGACGGYIKNGDWTVALDARHYDRGNVCNRMIRITANGKTQVARIGDRCEMCRQTDGIDMTPGLFSSFANQDVGIISVTWDFVDGSGNNNGGGNNDWKPDPPKQETTKQAPPKTEWKPPQQTPKTSKQAWTPPKETWTSSKNEWKPPATTSKHSEPAWTPSTSKTPTPSPQSQNNNQGNDDNEQTSSHVSSAAASASNVTTTQTASTGDNIPSSAIAGSSAIASVSASSNSQQNASAPVSRHALAHLHQAVLQVASLVVEAADAI